jgi:hypothetical protein
MASMIDTERFRGTTETGAIRAEIRQGFAQLRGELQALQTRMMQWFVGTAIAIVTAVFTLLKVMHP